MDLNRILLFLAGISPLLLLVRTLRRPRTHRGWTLAALVVLGVTIGAWFMIPRFAGYIGGVVWFLLLLVPALGARQLEHLALEQRFHRAYWLASLLRILHPADGIPAQAKLFEALRLLHEDSAVTRTALRRLDLTPDESPGRLATAYGFSLENNWAGFLEWFRRGGQHGMHQDPWLLPFFLRALAEIRSHDECIAQFAARTHTFSHTPEAVKLRAVCALVVLSFCGRERDARTVVTKRLSSFPERTLAFWRGYPDRDTPVLADSSARILHRLEEELTAAAPTRTRFFPRLTGAVVLLLGANVGMFGLEAALGGWDNPVVLHRLGQLETWSVLQSREYWRLLSMLFLHAGVLHLLFNLFGIYLLGPGLERVLGFARFLVCYLLSGLGSSVGVVLLHVWGRVPAQQVVGASGALMGLVGVWAAYFLRHPHAPNARQRLQSILFIVVVQVAFDLWTPQISMAAHLCGLASGFALGLLLPRQSAPPPERS